MLVIMKEVLIKMKNSIFHGRFLTVNLTIHFNIPNGIEFSSVDHYSMEECGVLASLPHPLLFGSFPP